MVTVGKKIANIKGVKGESLRNPRHSGDNVLVDHVVTNQITGAETVTTVDLGNFRGPAVVPGVQNVTVSGATTVPVLLDKMYMLSGAGTVTLTGEVGVFATVVLAAGMRIAGVSVAAGMWVVINHPDVGWKVYPTPAPVAGDTTPPTPGSLAALLHETSGLLRVSNAVDETAPNELPYRFSTDGGTTWSAWQASSTYVLSSLTAGTSYTFRHQTRDASANVSTGAVATASTAPSGTWTTRMLDTFTAADGTAVAGRTPDTGTAWTTGTATIKSEKLSGPGWTNTTQDALWPNGAATMQRVRVTTDYSVPTNTPYVSTWSPLIGFNSAVTNYFNISFSGSGAFSMSMYGGGTTWSATTLASTAPTSGTFVFDYHPGRRVAVVRVGTTVLGYFSGGTDLPFYGVWHQLRNGATVDPMRVEVSST